LTRTRILIAEDHEGMRVRVVRLLEPEFEVVGTAGDGLTLLEAARKMKPDVCVLDISMPKMSGIEAATQLGRSPLGPKIVFLTVNDDSDFVRAALGAGALGYVVKSRMASDLRSAIREALAGRLFISPSCCYELQGERNEDVP
jgi:DNA-binding NarL/FixJ family response regulator